ncbi:MAG: GTPase [Patescibacteria group bacterium]|nr:GTPase [Patescibacteria group bacterium]
MLQKIKKIIIIGAAGRDFHNFLVYFKDNPEYRVVCFTAAQIPGIEKRHYPASLAGKLYPRGIPIYPEKDLVKLVKKFKVDEIVFSYSDVSYQKIMNLASSAMAVGASFRLLGPRQTMIISRRKVIAVCATRTGAGKSMVSRTVLKILRKRDYRVAVIRHPMPYDPNLKRQEVQKFSTYEDLNYYRATIEEREEYEPYLEDGASIYAGIDYQKILKAAEKEAEIILWDGGNNDFSFIQPNFYITVADPHRVGDELNYWPSAINLILSDLVIISKISTASKKSARKMIENIRLLNQKAKIIQAKSETKLSQPELIKGKNVLIVEDAPTITHGEAESYGLLLAKKFKAKKIISPQNFVVGEIKKTFQKYPYLQVVPTMGYSQKQMKDLEKTINRAQCDTVLAVTSADLSRLIQSNKPIVKVRNEFDQKTFRQIEKILPF